MPVALLSLLACSRFPGPDEAPAVGDIHPSPSFDCTRAEAVVEHVICEDGFLATLDVALDRHYRDALAAGGSTLRSQLDWLAARDACESVPDVRACVLLAYTSRLRELCALTSPWCGVYAQGTLDYNDPIFKGMGVVSVIPADEYESLFVAATAIADNPGRASCGVELWTREVDGDLLASSRGGESPLCIARLRRTRDGIRINTSEECQSAFCGAAAGWGGDYRRLREAGEQRQWESLAYE